MKIKTGRRIEIECQNSDKDWNKKWVAVGDVLKILNDDSITCFEDLYDNLQEELKQALSKIRTSKKEVKIK